MLHDIDLVINTGRGERDVQHVPPVKSIENVLLKYGHVTVRLTAMLNNKRITFEINYCSGSTLNKPRISTSCFTIRINGRVSLLNILIWLNKIVQ